jgi:hypothetical protein
MLDEGGDDDGAKSRQPGAVLRDALAVGRGASPHRRTTLGCPVAGQPIAPPPTSIMAVSMNGRHGKASHSSIEG